MNKIAIIILHFGDYKITNDCLNSLAKINNGNSEVKIFVLDNQGNIKRHDNPTNTEFIPFINNLGFARGNNYVVNQIKNQHFDYYLFLNNDTTVDSNFIIQLIEVLDKNPTIGISGPVIEHTVNESKFFDYGGNIIWLKGQPKHINKQKYERTDKYIERDFVSGCCLCIKSDLFHKLKGFDARYFMYLEDVDLCVRAKKIGYKTVCVSGSKIFHLGSKSASVNFKIKQSLVNGLRFTFTHVPQKFKLPALFFNLVFYPSLWLRWNLKRFIKAVFCF